MASTGFCPPPAARPFIPPTEEDTHLRHRRIQGEVQDENAWLLKGAGGHAGLFSNVPDLLRFAGEILKAGSESEETGYLSAARWRFLPSGRVRKAAPGRWGGYAVGESSSAASFLRIRLGIWVTAAAPCGLTSRRGLRWCC